MATTEELNNQIAEARRSLQAAEQCFQQLDAEKAAALERQRLREELKALKEVLDGQRRLNHFKREQIANVDADRNSIGRGVKTVATLCPKFVSCKQKSSCNASVVKGEFVWEIEGMSWLSKTLRQTMAEYLDAPFLVGDHVFRFRYAPKGCESEDRRGSLVIVHHWKSDDDVIVFRYRVLIKRAQGDGEFVLWGAGDEFTEDEYPSGEQIFGPDVQFKVSRAHPAGIFGLSHDQLLSSEWVHEDTLTVKFELEIRRDNETEVLREKQIEIVPSTISANLLGLLEDAKCSDVSFIVQGQQVKAHSQILSARSEYFHKALNGGLRESISKEVVVDDCDVESFKALLSFLYSDDFSHIELMIKTASARDTASQKEEESTSETKIHSSILLNMLSLSHRYQIARLQSWCEHKLSACISVDSVCSVLHQAHLFEAKQLERECYKLIKSNLLAVMRTPAYVKVLKEWPEVALKLHLFSSGLPESDAESLLQTQLKTMHACGSKRKRED